MNNIKRSVLFALLLLVAMPMALVAQSDEPITTIDGKQYYVHKVKKGETFWGLSKTYNVSVEELTAANPDAVAGLKADAVINIPVAKKDGTDVAPSVSKPSVTVKPDETEEKPVVAEQKPAVTQGAEETSLDGKIRHEVLKGETIYGISHKYGVSEQELMGMNPGIESGLREGQVLVIPSKPVVAETNKNHDGELRHEVRKGETIYGISHQYGITEHDLIAKNPDIESGLKEGQTLVIPSKSKSSDDKGEKTPKVTVKPAQNTVVSVKAKEQPDNIYKVKKGETLYYVARKFGVDIADLKAANPGLTNFPIEGLPITIPERKIADTFFVHRVEENSKTSNFVKKWNLTEEEFRAINSSVGRRVYADQAVLIPMLKDADKDNDLGRNGDSSQSGGKDVVKPVVVVVAIQDTIQEQKADNVETETSSVVEPRIPCEPLSNARNATYRVALLLPLYLEEVDNIQVRSDYVENARKARPFKFLHYYEGFMMAANKLSEEGLNLDLQVIDVDEDVNKAKKAIDQMKQSNVDVIIGPFFSRSFSVVSEYAAQNDIMIVNPLSERQNILENNANVVKVKPDYDTQLDALCNLLTEKYQDALCTVFVPVGKENDSVALAMAKTIKTRVKNDTVDVNIYPCNNASFKTLETLSSSKRNTVVVAYGDKLVFATQMLNSLNKTANKTPLTLIALPDWDKFENLLVDNLMRMNAIYFSDYFIDYADSDVNDFVDRFRSLYKYDPDKYAFMGYDMADYFLNALMLYGSKPCDCLQDYSPRMMHTRFDFNRETRSNGMENTFWNVYQYDNEETVLKILNR